MDFSIWSFCIGFPSGALFYMLISGKSKEATEWAHVDGFLSGYDYAKKQSENRKQGGKQIE